MENFSRFCMFVKNQVPSSYIENRILTFLLFDSSFTAYNSDHRIP